MLEKNKKAVPEWLTAGIAFVYYFIIALYKLTEAPIWQDEALDFYCSFMGKGYINGIGDYANSYERLVGLLNQPPLFGVIIGIWLRISEAEWWLRFSSVLFGFGAAVGIYMVIKKLCDRYMAAFSVIICSSLYIFMYYVKEMAEYIMIFTVMTWGVYLYLRIYEAIENKELNNKHVLLLTGFCIIAMYTQYGAAFAVVPMATVFIVTLWKNRDYAKLKLSIISFVVAGIVSGIPLVYFFFLPQSRGDFSVFAENKEMIIEGGNIVSDFCFSLMSVFRWFLIDLDRDGERLTVFIYLGLLILALVISYVIKKTDKKFVRIFLIWNIITFLFYYSIVKTNVYAYGWFGNRYNLFIYPQLYILMMVVIYEFVHLLIGNSKIIFSKCGRIIRVGLIVFGIFFCIYGDYRIHNHWDKMDLRRVADKWYEVEGYEKDTFLDYTVKYSFTYYLTHDKRYDEGKWNKIVWNEDVATSELNNKEYWAEYMEKTYNGKLPDEMYVVTHAWNSLMDYFKESGYEIETVEHYTADMYLVKKVNK